MTPIKQGEIYWLENIAPVGDEYTNKRAFVVVDRNDFIRDHSVICAVPLTTKTSKLNQEDVMVKKDPNNNLFYDSLAKLSHLSSFDKGRFVSRIGFIDAKTMNDIYDKLRRRFQ